MPQMGPIMWFFFLVPSFLSYFYIFYHFKMLTLINLMNFITLSIPDKFIFTRWLKKM